MNKLKIYSDSDFPKYLPRLNTLYDDLFADGKGFRAKLIQKISKHLALDEKKILLLGQTIEFIHNASLLHDDLIDRAHLRRNKTTAWLKYTPEYAVLAGDYLLARVMVNLSSHGNLELIQVTSETISNLLEGEWIQDSLLRDWNIRLEQLDRVHLLKTASLFSWCLRAPFIANNQNESRLHVLLKELGALIGLLFQRSDDLLDFDIRNYEKKHVLGDLKSGYLNSFAAFISADLSSERKNNFIKAQTLDEVFSAVGAKLFADKLAAFDEINQNLIDLFHHQLTQLKELLPETQKSLIHELRPIPEPIYWRKSSP